MSKAEPESPSGVEVVADRLRREHPGGIVAVDNVSLTIEPGEFVVLTGPSGSGKTSLLSLIGALDKPTSGRVIVGGAELDAGSDDRARFHRDVVGFVFQHHHLLGHLPACANVELPLLGAGMGRRERRERAVDLLREVGLGHRLDSVAAHLSGGERQRVAIARALANDPRLLLADEPTGALDSETTDQIMELFCALHAAGMTIILVTHEPAVAAYAQRVLRVRDGRVVADERRGGPTLAA